MKPAPCWVDPSLPRNPKNYCRAYWRNPSSGRPYTFAHTASWARAAGQDVPAGMHVAHRCANPACWNPAHLYLATPKENEADKRRVLAPCPVEWHAWARGAVRKHGALVEPIRARAAAGESLRGIARALGLPRQTVCDIVAGRTWRPPTA